MDLKVQACLLFHSVSYASGELNPQLQALPTIHKIPAADTHLPTFTIKDWLGKMFPNSIMKS
jgi:hypothetical protein